MKKRFLKIISLSLALIVCILPQAAYAASGGSSYKTAQSLSSSAAGSAAGQNSVYDLNKVNITAGWPQVPDDLICGSIIVYETNTDLTLYSLNEDTVRYPASTTKLLTGLLAVENCSLSETVTFSQNAITLVEGASSIDAVAGEQMSLKDCLYGLMLESGNDCAVAIAEHVAGSVEAFSDMMNERAAELGCTNSHFVNPNGLFEEDHYSTASDLLLISKAAFENSALVEILSTSLYTIPATNMSGERAMINTNCLVDEDSEYYDEDVICGKTGYEDLAGRCLITLSEKNGIEVIVVLLYCPTLNGVFPETSELIDYVFDNFKSINVADEEERFSYSCTEAPVYIDRGAQLFMPNTVDIEDLDSQVTYSEDAADEDGDGISTYATISYSYLGNYLGSANVLTDSSIKSPEIKFKTVLFVSPLPIAIGGAILIILMLAVTGRRKTSR